MNTTNLLAELPPAASAFARFRRNRLAVASAVFLLLELALALLAPLIAPYDYAAQNLDYGPQPPSAAHPLGTDELGRDMLTRCLYGARTSFAVGFVASGVAMVIGVIWGIIAGYIGGRTDQLMMRFVDILYGLPFIIFIILLMVAFGRSLVLIFLAIGAVEWLTMARIVRGQTRQLREREFVLAARALGLSPVEVMRRHIAPNVVGIVCVYLTLTIPTVMILEAFLSFLGLGIQPPQSSWGLLISYGVNGMEEYPWLLLIPGGLFALTLFTLNFVGDGMRDAFDPQSSLWQ